MKYVATFVQVVKVERTLVPIDHNELAGVLIAQPPVVVVDIGAQSVVVLGFVHPAGNLGHRHVGGAEDIEHVALNLGLPIQVHPVRLVVDARGVDVAHRLTEAPLALSKLTTERGVPPPHKIFLN